MNKSKPKLKLILTTKNPMTNNKISNFNELNNKENLEEIKEIKIGYKKFSDKQLVIENYSKLESLQLLKVNSIDKITLKNLTQLKECTIQGCGVTELVIENCPQIKTLNVRDNSLTNLEFLATLENLEELELDGNAELIKTLKPYKGDWKNYQKDKDIQEIFELTKQSNLREIVKKCLDLKKSREDLKKDVSFLLQPLSKRTQQKTISSLINTEELVLNLEKEFKEKEEKINSLELRVRELTELSEEQRQKIQTHLENFGSEQESIRKLIIEYLRYIKFKNEAETDDDFEKLQGYEECYQKIQDELKNKLGKANMIKVKRILIDCEKLIEQEQEIENKLNDKSSLIEEQKQKLILKTVKNSEEKTKLEEQEMTHKKQVKQKRKMSYDTLEKTLFETQGQLTILKEENEKKHEIIREAALTPKNQNQWNIEGDSSFSNQSNNTYQQYNVHYRQLETETEKEITASLTDQKITPQEQKIINQTILFLGTKELFINYRQASIDSLIGCYNKLEKSTGKLNRFTTASSMTNIAGKLAKIIPGGGAAETPIGLLGDTINLTGTIIKEKDLKKFTKHFQEILDKDKKNLPLFDGNCLSLINTVWKDNKTNQGEIVSTIIKTLNLERTKISPFSDDYNVFSQSVSGIWQGRSSLPLEEIKSSIESVINNFQELKQKLQDQKKQLTDQEWFKAIDQRTDLLKGQQPQISEDEKLVVATQRLSIQDSQKENSTQAQIQIPPK